MRGDMSSDVVPKVCDRCGMPDHGSTSCEANRPTFDIEMETYEFEKAQELADEAGWSWLVDYVDYEDEKEDEG